MASTDDAEQTITFHYQQEGRASGFNQLITDVIPYGVISGGELSLIGGGNVQIAKFNMIINGGSCAIHLTTGKAVTRAISSNLPFVVVRFDWEENTENYADIECKAFNDIGENDIVLGKIEFVGSEASQIDYTCKSWASIYYENLFLPKNTNYKSMMMPSFHVYPAQTFIDNTYEFNISAGSAYINGKYVELTTSKSVTLTTTAQDSTKYHYFVNTVSNNRKDLICLDENGEVVYILGEDSVSATPPKVPRYLLPIAIVNLSATTGSSTIRYILGSYIQNIYNNNFIGQSAVFGKQENGIMVNTHTLYI